MSVEIKGTVTCKFGAKKYLVRNETYLVEVEKRLRRTVEYIALKVVARHIRHVAKIVHGGSLIELGDVVLKGAIINGRRARKT